MSTDFNFWAKCTVAQLKEECSKREISIAGVKLKSELVKRIIDYEKEHQEPVEDEVLEEDGGGENGAEKAEIEPAAAEEPAETNEAEAQMINGDEPSKEDEKPAEEGGEGEEEAAAAAGDQQDGGDEDMVELEEVGKEEEEKSEEVKAVEATPEEAEEEDDGPQHVEDMEVVDEAEVDEIKEEGDEEKDEKDHYAFVPDERRLCQKGFMKSRSRVIFLKKCNPALLADPIVQDTMAKADRVIFNYKKNERAKFTNSVILVFKYRYDAHIARIRLRENKTIAENGIYYSVQNFNGKEFQETSEEVFDLVDTGRDEANLAVLPSNVMIIKNMPDSITEATLQDYFRNANVIDIILDKEGNKTGTALLVFGRPRECRLAYNRKKVKLEDGHELTLESYKDTMRERKNKRIEAQRIKRAAEEAEKKEKEGDKEGESGDKEEGDDVKKEATSDAENKEGEEKAEGEGEGDGEKRKSLDSFKIPKKEGKKDEKKDEKNKKKSQSPDRKKARRGSKDRAKDSPRGRRDRDRQRRNRSPVVRNRSRDRSRIFRGRDDRRDDRRGSGGRDRFGGRDRGRAGNVPSLFSLNTDSGPGGSWPQRMMGTNQQGILGQPPSNPSAMSNMMLQQQQQMLLAQQRQLLAQQQQSLPMMPSSSIPPSSGRPVGAGRDRYDDRGPRDLGPRDLGPRDLGPRDMGGRSAGPGSGVLGQFDPSKLKDAAKAVNMLMNFSEIMGARR